LKKLSPFEQSLFWAYGIWMTLGLWVTLGEITESTLLGWSLPGPLLAFVSFCLRQGDAISILLAAMNLHCWATRTWGTPRARLWAIVVMLASGLIETVGTLTGYPFGPYFYTENFGPRLFDVLPLAIPLAWYVLVTGALILLRPSLPNNIWVEAAAVGLAVTLIDALMEPFAVRIKAYWLWETDSGMPPWQNYLAWFTLSAALVRWAAPPQRVHEKWDWRVAAILGGILVLFVTARIVHGV
jgi:uncharacterized membrane protein